MSSSSTACSRRSLKRPKLELTDGTDFDTVPDPGPHVASLKRKCESPPLTKGKASSAALPIKKKRNMTRILRKNPDNGYSLGDRAVGEAEVSDDDSDEEDGEEAEDVEELDGYSDDDASQQQHLIFDNTLTTSNEKTKQSSRRRAMVQSQPPLADKPPLPNCHAFGHNITPGGTTSNTIRTLAAGVRLAKRERRLARNRETARERRRRQKSLIEQLDRKFLLLSRENHELRTRNERLKQALESNSDSSASSASVMQAKIDHPDENKNGAPAKDGVATNSNSACGNLTQGGKRNGREVRSGISNRRARTEDSLGVNGGNPNCDVPRGQLSTCKNADVSSLTSAIAKAQRSIQKLHSEPSKHHVGTWRETEESHTARIGVSPSATYFPSGSFATLPSHYWAGVDCCRSAPGVESTISAELFARKESAACMLPQVPWKYSYGDFADAVHSPDSPKYALEQRLALLAKANAILSSCNFRSEGPGDPLGC